MVFFVPLVLLILASGCPVNDSDSEVALVADFSASPRAGTHPLTVEFTNRTQGTYYSQCWDFGDGCESLEREPTHDYQNPGIFTVTLTLYDASYRILTAEAILGDAHRGQPK
jgi:PKD repeat protein